MTPKLGLVLVALIATISIAFGTMSIGSIGISSDGKLVQYDVYCNSDPTPLELAGIANITSGILMLNPVTETFLLIMHNTTTGLSESQVVNLHQ